MIILGIPIGQDLYQSSSCCNSVKSVIPLCSQLVHVADLQSSLLLLRYCHVPRLNLSSRTISPDVLQPVAITRDIQTRDCFSQLLGYDGLPEMAWRQATLQIRLGRFGMTSASALLNAFIASLAHSNLELPLRYPYLHDACQSLMKSPSGSLDEALVNLKVLSF